MEIVVKEDVSCYASETQQKVLGIISGIDIITKRFFITGGTTLSVFFLHHRTSEDIDFFSTEYRDLNNIHPTLQRIFKNDLTFHSCRLYFCPTLRITSVSGALGDERPYPDG
jgi:hypothetical protein